MLIGNFTVLNKTPGKFLSGSTQTQERSNFNLSGANRNRFFGDRGTFYAKFDSGPVGQRPPYSYMIATSEGGIASSVNTFGSASITNNNLAGGLNGASSLTGSGNITSANLGLIVSIIASIMGSGGITPSPMIVGILNATAGLTGGGSLAAGENSYGNFIANILSTGTISNADLRAAANLSASIVSFGTLSPENLALAVMHYLIEGNYTFEQTVKILAAVAAGKTTITPLGGGAATVTFRDLIDTKDTVTASMTSSARSSVTLNP